MKKMIIFIVVVIVITVCVIGNVNDTTNYSGFLAENNSEVNIEITRTNFDKIFNRISKDMIVVGSGVDYHYIFSGKIIDMNEYYAVPIRRMSGSGLATQGYLFFDDEMKNIVIETGQEVVFSCKKEFFDMVTK